MACNSTRSQNQLELIIDSYVSSFKKLKTLNLDSILNRLIIDIHEYNIIKAIGVGNTALSAEQLIYAMYFEDKFIDLVPSKIKIDMLESCMKSNYLLIIFSESGSSDNYGDIMKTAKEKNIKTYLITMNPNSELLNLTQNVIILPSTPIEKRNNTLFRIDDRTILYGFAEVIAYYYATFLIND